MKFIRRQVLSQRAPTNRSLFVDLGGEIVMSQPYNLTVPRGTTAQRSVDGTTFVNGMIRYNSQTNEFEGYQNGAWRSFRFKEPGNVILQVVGTGDAIETTFGPLSPDPFATARAQSGTTWNATQMAKNIIVVVENVFQIGTVNFTVVQNPVGKPAGTYIVFGTPVPLGKPVYVFYNFDA